MSRFAITPTAGKGETPPHQALPAILEPSQPCQVPVNAVAGVWQRCGWPGTYRFVPPAGPADWFCAGHAPNSPIPPLPPIGARIDHAAWMRTSLRSRR